MSCLPFTNKGDRRLHARRLNKLNIIKGNAKSALQKQL